MGVNCSTAKASDVKKIPNFGKTLKQLGIEIGSLTNAEVNAVITKLCTSTKLSQDEVLKPKNKGMIADAIANERNKRAEEKAELEALTNGKIGDAVLSIGERVSKNDPRNNKDTLYVYTNNLQAHNAVTGDEVSVDGLIEPADGATINVSRTSALMRTDTNGTPNPNVKGLVVKMNAQDANGRWIQEDGVFKDTDEAFEVFKSVNEGIVKDIAKVLGINGERATYSKVSFVKRIALDNAGLPERFAKELAKMLKDELGLDSQVLKSKVGKNLYGLEVQPKKGIGGNRNSSNKKSDKAKAAKEAAESLKAERPLSETPNVEQDTRSLLVNLFPDIAERKARVDFISSLFSSRLTYYLNTVKKMLEEADESQLSDDEIKLKDTLNSADDNTQRVIILGYVESSGKSLASRIISDIKMAMEQVVDTFDKGEEGINTLIEGLLNEDSLFGSEFAIERFQNGWTGQKLDKILHQRVAYLADAFRKIINTPNAFEALLNAAASDIEFRENIRLSVDKDRTIETAKDTEDIDEEGSSDNRSGLSLVKYKLLNPAKTLSVRIKNLLSNQYKASYSLTEGTKYVFNDLGQRVRMNPSAVYYKLLDEFCKMNRPEDFLPMLDKIETDYPWFGDLKQKILADEDLRNEFYRAFRKVFVPYAVISPNGNIQFKNSTLATAAFLDNFTKNYEGRIVLGKNSIYTEEGECNPDNVAKTWMLFSIPAKGHRSLDDEYFQTKHPFKWVFTVLNRSSKKANSYTVENVRKALSILRGEVEEHSKVSLESLLNNLGIDTTDLNLEALIPYISDEEWEDIGMSETPLDDMEKLFTPDQMNKVRSILLAAQTIVHPEYGFKKGGNLVNDLKSSYMKIGNALTIASEGYSMSSFYHDGNQRFSYSAPDFISTLTGIMSSVATQEDIEYGTAYMENNYGQYDFFRDPQTKEWLSPWMEDLVEDMDVRENFSYLNVLSIGNSSSNSIGKVNNDEFLDGLVCAFYGGSTKDGKEFGYYRNPLFSDTDALVLFKQRKYTGENFKQEILNRLTKVFRQELNRIADARTKKSSAKTSIEFYNDERNNAAKFNFFTAFAGHEGEIIDRLKEMATEDPINYTKNRDAFIQSLLAPMLEAKFADFMNQFSEARKLRLYSKILKNINESSEKTEEDEDENEATTVNLEEATSKASKEWKIGMVNQWLEQFYYNDYFAQSQLIQLLYGDLAYSKNVRDFIKRNKQAYASGEKMYAKNPDGSPMTETSIYLADKEVRSNTWSMIRELLESNESLTSIEKDMIKGAINSFSNITETDGQSFRTLKSFRKIFKAMGGKWTDNMEKSYNRILNGDFNIEDFMAFWNPIKPFLFSHETKTANGRNEKVVVQHKNSEYALSAMYSVLNTALNKSPELVALNQFMDEHDIDVAHFHSVVKEGFNSPFDINHDDKAFQRELSKNGGSFEVGSTTIKASSYKDYVSKLDKALEKGTITQQEYNSAKSKFDYHSVEDVKETLEDQLLGDGVNTTKDDMLHVFPMEDYIVVQPSDDHLTDALAVFGSQLRNIMPADLSEDFTMDVAINGQTKTLNREEAVKYYNMLIVHNLIDSFSAIDKKFSNIKSLKSMLDAAIKGNPRYGDDVKAALELNEDGTAFKMPFNSSNLTNKIEDLLLSVFKNQIQRQKINGGNVVLVSNFGLSDSLHVKYKDENDPSKGIDYIPAYMPAYMRSMFTDYLVQKDEVRKDGSTVSYWTIDYDKLEKNNEKELLNIIGYRIPTEDKYSIMPIRIMGFMPIVAGTTIMLPSDIITMSGTDFDIDKLFLMIRSSVREVAGSNLGKAFRKWVAKNRKKSTSEDAINQLSEAITEEIGNTESLEKFFSRRGRGYTQQELASMMDKSPLFSQFMEEVGADLLYETPKYVIEKPTPKYDENGDIDLDATSRMEDIKSINTRKNIRNNMLIDTIWNILTSPNGSRLCMTPASYRRVSHSSRQQRVLRNPIVLEKFMEVYKDSIKKDGLYNTLDRLSTKELDGFINQYGMPDDPMDIGFYIDSHRNLMDGNDLIGTFAVSSSSHYKFQFANLTLAKANQFDITIPGYKTVTITSVDSQRSPITGELIGRINSEFQAASPDNGKDPTLGDLGISNATAYRAEFLGRVGMPPEVIGILNTSDDFRSFGKTAVKGKVDWHSYNGDIGKLTEMLAEYRLTGDIKSNIDRIEAAKFAGWMNNIDECARALQDAGCFSRSDSPNGALAISSAEAIQQILKAREFMKNASEKSFPIQGFDKVIDIEASTDNSSLEDLRDMFMKKPIPRLQAFYTLGIRSGINLANRYLPQINDQIIEAVQSLRAEVGDIDSQRLLSKKGVKVLRSYINELPMYILSKDSIFSSDKDGKSIKDKRNYYIHDFPMKLRAFLEEKKDGSYVHKDIRDLTLIQMLNIDSKNGIRFVNVGGKVSPESRKYFMEDLEYMLHHSDPEVSKLAMDLLMYSFYDNGMSFGHSNFGIFFTTHFMRAIPRYIENLRQANSQMLTDKDTLERYNEQFMLNHPDILVGIKSNEFRPSSTDDKIITITSKRAKNRVLEIVNGELKPVKFIATKDFLGNVKDVYEVVLDEYGYANLKTPQYRKISYNKQQFAAGTPYYDATVNATEIEWDGLLGRGAVVSSERANKVSQSKTKNSDNDKADSLDEAEKNQDKVTSEAASSFEEVEQSQQDEISDDAFVPAGDKLDEKHEKRLMLMADSLDAIERQSTSMAMLANSLKEVAKDIEGKAPKETTLEDFNEPTDPDNTMCK